MKYKFFFKQDSPFSQWYKSKFTLDGITFNCMEQYMMFKKAQLFNDKDAAKAILSSDSPKEQKAIGRKVRNFNVATWEKKCEDIVYDGNYAKFTQNTELMDILLSTGDTILAEASPYDEIWGIGLSEHDPRAQKEHLWPGKNKLGFILTSLREDIKK